MIPKDHIKSYFLNLQELIVSRMESLDGKPFRRDAWDRPEGGGGISRLVEEGNILERAGVNFSHVMGNKLPPSATAHRPELAGRHWEAMGVSLVFHPRNPYIPTVHMNVRCFIAEKDARRRCGGLAAAWTSRPTTALTRMPCISMPPAKRRWIPSARTGIRVSRNGAMSISSSSTATNRAAWVAFSLTT
jgi:hypothetical protein